MPFVYRIAPLKRDNYTYIFNGNVVIAKGKANLRRGPNTEAPIIEAAAAGDTLLVLGQNQDWLHVKTQGGIVAFLHKSLVKEGK